MTPRTLSRRFGLGDNRFGLISPSKFRYIVDIEVSQRHSVELPTGTVTFLMSDVEGSTRRWEVAPEGMRAAMARHDAVLARVVGAHHGTLLKQRGEGDSHFAVFASAVDGVRAALEIQEQLQRENWGEVGEIRVRIALHTGESELRGDDYYGPAVHRCARIRAAGHGGQVLLSQITRKLIQDQTSQEIRIEDLGRHRLKDLLDAERIFQVSAPGLLQDFPPLKTLDLVRHNLPVQLSSFVGREKEIAEVRQALFKKRLVTLAGTGGSGKTRLALQVGAEAVDQYPDGVWFIDLVSVTDGKQTGQEIASQLKLPPESSEAVESQLEDWNALLILDNCEQIVAGAAKLVNRLLKACSGLTFLATSREPLAIAGELVYRTPPLAYELGSEPANLEAVAQLDAPKLLLERARDRGQGDLLREDNAAWIAKLCKRLDGIPLAIEQAAANLDVLTPKQLLAKLDHHFSMRGLEDEGVPDRHRTLEATIDWSYQMLAEKERKLFERLSVFVGGWSLDGCRAVCQGDGIAEREVDDLLGSLIRKSLVASSQTAWEDRRFRLLEVVREYALGKAEAEATLEERHYAYFNSLAQESLIQLTGPNQAVWAQRMEAEHENLRKAIRWAQDHNCSAEIAVGMRRFWIRMGFVREGLAILRLAVEEGPELDPVVEATAFNAMGAFAFKLEELSQASRYYAQSLSIWRELGRVEDEASVLHNLALVSLQSGRAGEAMQWLEESLELQLRHSNEAATASCYMSLGVLQLHYGKSDLADKYLSEAVVRFKRLEDHHNQATSTSLLGDLRFGQGRISEGIENMLEALAIWSEVHDPYAAGIAALSIAEVALAHGEVGEAVFLKASVQHIFKEIGSDFEDYSLARMDRIDAQSKAMLSSAEIQRICRAAGSSTLSQLVQRAHSCCKSIAAMLKPS